MVFFKVVGWIVLIGSAVWAVRTVRRQQYNSLGKYIHVLERIPIGSGQTLLYLEVDDIGVVVGATPQRFDVIYITDYKLSEVERETYSRSGNVFHLRPVNTTSQVNSAQEEANEKRRRLHEWIERTVSFLRNGGNKE